MRARACVWFGMHLYVYKYCLFYMLNVDISLKRDFFNQRVSNYLVCLFTLLTLRFVGLKSNRSSYDFRLSSL